MIDSNRCVVCGHVTLHRTETPADNSRLREMTPQAIVVEFSLIPRETVENDLADTRAEVRFLVAETEARNALIERLEIIKQARLAVLGD